MIILLVPLEIINFPRFRSGATYHGMSRKQNASAHGRMTVKESFAAEKEGMKRRTPYCKYKYVLSDD